MNLLLYLLAMIFIGAFGVVAIYIRFVVVLLCIGAEAVTHTAKMLAAVVAATQVPATAEETGRPKRPLPSRSRRSAA